MTTPQRKVQTCMNILNLVIALLLGIHVVFVQNFAQPEMPCEITMSVIIKLLKCNLIVKVCFVVHEALVNSKMWKREGSWACTDCEYSSKNNSNVYEHIEGKHVTSPGYICLVCNRTCSTRKALRCHKYRNHNDSNIYVG